MRPSAFRYLIDAKRPLADVMQSGTNWDVFISAYNDSDRVQDTFQAAPAARKCWWMLPEYAYEKAEFPNGAGSEVHFLENFREEEIVAQYVEKCNLTRAGLRICIDITGFMRPHILYFLTHFKEQGIRQFDMVYTEPQHYSRKAETAFSLDNVSVVRQVIGYEGQHATEMDNDVLVVGMGYDHDLVARVMLAKQSASLIELHSFPSLSADMYHESILRLDRVSPSSHSSYDQVFFSSANDPFVTASALSDLYQTLLDRGRPITNLYLSPLATKPQALGFGLFYLRELESRAASIIFPFTAKYSRETSEGTGRSWVYPIVL